ncbi:hypothetical protein CEH05_20490 (plasmid) [Halobacillus halophilus]|uniref:hypothetical protein n=1 Tax=Halobacillus halophilus TaxID=1570 RepID=UPI000B517F93|nr:hypothetical protein [Halobacillus halophilus]ASF41572.1 hypothetical protein CEH05_20490 [Halobacillus halophilus]
MRNSNDHLRIVSGSMAVKEVKKEDGRYYAVGIELVEDGEPFRTYSLSYNAEEYEIYSRRKVAGRAIFRVAFDLPKDVDVLDLETLNRLGKKKTYDHGKARLPKRKLDIHIDLGGTVRRRNSRNTKGFRSSRRCQT